MKASRKLIQTFQYINFHDLEEEFEGYLLSDECLSIDDVWDYLCETMVDDYVEVDNDYTNRNRCDHEEVIDAVSDLWRAYSPYFKNKVVRIYMEG